MPVPYGELAYSNLPAKHPARQPAPRRTDWWKLIVSGPCSWCGEVFTAVAASMCSASRYCSSNCAKAKGRAAHGSRFRVSPVVRQAIYERDGWVCQLCEDPVDPDLHPSDPWAATLDHIVPQSWQLIPDHRPEALRLAHRWCNSVRGDERHYTEEVLRREAAA